VHTLPGGALTTFLCKFGPAIFFSTLGVTCTQCTPGYAYGPAPTAEVAGPGTIIGNPGTTTKTWSSE